MIIYRTKAYFHVYYCFCLATRAIAFAAIEGLFFSGSFAIIFWFKSRNLLKGLSQANEFISRDEGLHTKFTCMLYSMIENKPSEKIVHNIIKDAVEIEIEFQKDALSAPQLGLNINTMSTYIKYVGDFLLTELGHNKLYNVENPFTFMQNIGLYNKSNDFELQNTNYKTGNDTSFIMVDEF